MTFTLAPSAAEKNLFGLENEYSILEGISLTLPQKSANGFVPVVCEERYVDCDCDGVGVGHGVGALGIVLFPWVVLFATLVIVAYAQEGL